MGAELIEDLRQTNVVWASADQLKEFFFNNSVKGCAIVVCAFMNLL